MTEPTITCPNCKTEIKLTESLAAPLIESTRRQYEQALSQKDVDIAKREQATRDKEKQLVEAKPRLDEQIANQVEEQLKKRPGQNYSGGDEESQTGSGDRPRTENP